MKTFTSESLKKSPHYDKIIYFVINHDLLEIFQSEKVVKYADLDNYETIYDLLSNKIDYCFILTENQRNVGHWPIITRRKGSFEYFDSYGDSPKTILDFIPSYMNKLLGNNYIQDKGKMIKSIKKTDTYNYNRIPLQQELEDINTCGRFSKLLRLF